MSTESNPPANLSESVTATPIVVPPAAPETPTPVGVDVKPAAWVLWLDYLVLALLLVLSFFLGSFIATNSEVAMHLAVGQRLSAGSLTFGVDPFSWATEATDGKPAVYWVNHSWLFSWLVYQLFQLIGDAGLVAVKAFVIVGAVGVLSRIGWTESNRWFVLMCLTLSALAMSARFTLQPQVVSLFFLSITLYLLDRAGVLALAERRPHAPREEKQHAERDVYDVRCLWALPPLFALWANLDHWFILGPLVVGLCWAGMGLGRWFRGTGAVPAKSLGIVFGAGLAACVLNPFHVRVFQLPPELAYLIVAITDPIGLALPDALVAGGRTLSELRQARMDEGMTLAAVTMDYWKTDRYGFNIAAIALVPLLLLGTGGFTLMALIKPQDNAPSLHVGRFLIWLVFAVMALALYRLIPFFALVAAPLTALTLGEFLHWQQEVGAVVPERRDRGLNLARGLSVPFLLLLLALAWPGMLYFAIDGYAPRHVAWGVRFEPSLERAALTLQTLKDKNECRNVFNIGGEMGNAMAWFAPDVKHGLDSRLALYSRDIGAYLKASRALLMKDGPDTDWQEWFTTRAIDQVVLSATFLQMKEHMRWWVEGARWRQRYGDNRTTVFSWSGNQSRWPVETGFNDWNARAFGIVPERLRPPPGGTLPAMPPTDFWAQFTETIGPTPTEVGEVAVLRRQFELVNQTTHPPLMMQLVSEKERRLIPHRHLMLLALGLPGATDATAQGVATHIHLMRPADFSAPSLPILMIRAARRAVAANPSDGRVYLALLQATEALSVQENYPGNEFGVSRLRERIRQVQALTALYHAAQLRPDDYRLQTNLYEAYLNANLFDLGLEQLRAAEKTLEAIKASGKEDPRQVDAELKKHRERVALVEEKVKERLAQWRDLPHKTPLEKAALAYGGNYTEVLGKQDFRTNLGLAKTALETLQAMPKGSLKEGEETYFITFRFELLLEMGRADIVAEDLRQANVSNRLHPLLLANYQIIAGAAVGDYANCELAFAALEKQAKTRLLGRRIVHAAQVTVEASALANGNFVGTLPLIKFSTLNLDVEQQELCNLITLRGILALEAGDTQQARALFQEALDQAGDIHFFADRPLARRYLDLLNEQRR